MARATIRWLPSVLGRAEMISAHADRRDLMPVFPSGRLGTGRRLSAGPRASAWLPCAYLAYEASPLPAWPRLSEIRRVSVVVSCIHRFTCTLAGNGCPVFSVAFIISLTSADCMSSGKLVRRCAPRGYQTSATPCRVRSGRRRLTVSRGRAAPASPAADIGWKPCATLQVLTQHLQAFHAGDRGRHGQAHGVTQRLLGREHALASLARRGR